MSSPKTFLNLPRCRFMELCCCESFSARGKGHAIFLGSTYPSRLKLLSLLTFYVTFLFKILIQKHKIILSLFLNYCRCSLFKSHLTICLIKKVFKSVIYIVMVPFTTIEN
jgi:hypothetical protein